MDKQNRRQITVLLNGKKNVIDYNPDEEEEVAVAREETYDKGQAFDRNEYATSDKKERPSHLKVLNGKRGPGKKKVSYKAKRKKRVRRIPGRIPANPLWRRLVLPLVTAVIIGTIFGMIVLSLFTKDTPIQPATEAGGPSLTELTSEPEENPPSGTVTFDQVATHVVQGGVFTTEAAADKFLKGIKQEGYAGALVKQDDSFYLFIGASGSEAGANALAEKYKADGREVYVKAYTVQGTEKKSSEEAAFVKASIDTRESLLEAVTNAIVSGEITNDRWQQTEKQIDDWLQKKPEKANDHATSMEKALLSTEKALQEWRGNKQDKQLWLAEQGMLDWLHHYKEWTQK